jgi:hypothetical protein
MLPSKTLQSSRYSGRLNLALGSGEHSQVLPH